MPTKRSRLTKTECQEYRSQLLQLGDMGIPIEYVAEDPLPKPDRFTLEQIEHWFARIYELPSGAVVVVAPAKLTVRTSGLLFMEHELRLPWDDFPLELCDPEENPDYQKLIGWLPHYSPPTILNRLLTPEVPLRHRQVQGVIFAEGWTDIPPECDDESLVTAELLLRDERRNEFCFEFGVRVDRKVKRKYERLQKERRELARSHQWTGLYGARGGLFADQKEVSPEESVKQPHASFWQGALRNAGAPGTGDR